VPGWPREAWAPLTALAVTLAVASGADPPLVGIVVLGAAAYACGAYARIVPGVAGVAAMLAATLLAGADDFVPVTITALGPWLAGRVVRSRSALVEALAQRTRELEAERDAATRLAVRHERARIARELHDIVAHNLAVMVVQAGAGRMAEQDPPERARERFDAIREAGEQALAEMARLTDLLGERRHDLRPLLDRARAAGLTIRAPELELDDTAYRVVQEAVTNVLKHAPGADVEIRVRAGEIEVRDSGARTAPTLAETGAGLGITGLRERIAAAGGTIEAGPRRDGGWSLRARLPLER